MKVGVLGGGQLGQMLTLAGYPIGITTTCFDQTPDVPAALVGKVVSGDITNREKLHRWAADVDVVTYEWENFPAAMVADLSEIRTVQPNAGALAAAQDRWHEKRLFDELEIPVTPFRLAKDDNDIKHAFDELGSPLVLKSRTGGYDGKRQLVLNSDDDLEPARQLMTESEVIVEQWVQFRAEVSAIGVRSLTGDITVYPVTENEHRRGILHASWAPARIPDELAKHAEKYVSALLKRLQYVGVLALEMFAVDGRLLANEMAPRVHNSGHWTIEGAETSQFENHLRAITGMPLGNTLQLCPSAMLNLIGEEPNRNEVLEVPGAHLHLYGKSPRPERKLGHVTVTAPNDEELRKRLLAVENVVTNRLGPA